MTAGTLCAARRRSTRATVTSSRNQVRSPSQTATRPATSCWEATSSTSAETLNGEATKDFAATLRRCNDRRGGDRVSTGTTGTADPFGWTSASWCDALHPARHDLNANPARARTPTPREPGRRPRKPATAQVTGRSSVGTTTSGNNREARHLQDRTGSGTRQPPQTDAPPRHRRDGRRPTYSNSVPPLRSRYPSPTNFTTARPPRTSERRSGSARTTTPSRR